jgi:hypothetical protein
MIKGNIGINAGIIWRILESTSDIAVKQLQKQSGLKEKEFNMALGWLAREHKVYFYELENTLFICLIF